MCVCVWLSPRPAGHALLDIGEHINVTCIPQDTAFVIYLDTATFFAELEFDVASVCVLCAWGFDCVSESCFLLLTR